MKGATVSAKQPYPSQYVNVLGAKMHYIEAGEGDPILFLHGIPTSSYVWRNVIPHLTSLGRCIAPDLIGMGQSDKPNIEYSIYDHIKYIERFIEELHLKNITLVMHGWGSMIGFDYAMRHENNCKGLVFYEAFLRSMNEAEQDSFPLQEQLLNLPPFDGPSFIDKILAPLVMRDLSDEEMNHYREPFIDKNSGKPISQYIEELAQNNGKSNIDSLIANYTTKLTQSSLPKLMMYSVPGFITTIATVMWAKEHLPHIEIIEVGEEWHLAQESNPVLMGESISAWLQSVEQSLHAGVFK